MRAFKRENEQKEREVSWREREGGEGGGGREKLTNLGSSSDSLAGLSFFLESESYKSNSLLSCFL